MELSINTKRKFVGLENVSKFLYCSLCDEIFRNPVRLKSCGHTYCLNCILEHSKHNFNCPLCQVNFTKNDIRIDIIATNIINDLKLYCINKGCHWKGKLSAFESHIKNCYFNPNKIPEYIKNLLDNEKANSKEKNAKESSHNYLGNESDEYNDNNLNKFNTKYSMRARVYNRSGELNNKVVSKNGMKERSKSNENKNIRNIKNDNLKII